AVTLLRYTTLFRSGSRLPAYPTSMGRVLLADLPDEELDAYIAGTQFEQLTERTVTDRDEFRAIIEKVRGDGYALVDQELEEGVRSIAAPITNEDGRVVAAMNVSCHASRVTVERMRKELRPHLMEAGRRSRVASACSRAVDRSVVRNQRASRRNRTTERSGEAGELSQAD